MKVLIFRNKEEKKYTLKNLEKLRVEEDFLILLIAKYLKKKLEGTGFSDKVSDHSTLKITPKRMLQKLPKLLAQVKVGNTSENLLNKIRQIMYSLYWAKEITKRVYNNIMNSLKL